MGAAVDLRRCEHASSYTDLASGDSLPLARRRRIFREAGLTPLQEPRTRHADTPSRGPTRLPDASSVRHVFLTGFPGFLGTRLLPRILGVDDAACCLVQPHHAETARRKLSDLDATTPGLEDRVRLVEGDITLPDLGLGDAGELKGSITEVFHLAAVYDLEVSRGLGTAVNVEGTRNVLNFAAGCSPLQRFHYVSTCYVSGRYAGVFSEDDLDVGQTFNNHYEETKHLAEAVVQRRMEQGFPITVYRPAVVVGDSRTGATQKYDGPYFFIRLLLRQGPVAFLPVVGDPTTVRANVVPRDFVVDAIAHLSGLPRSKGTVYQLADPAPPTVDEMLKEVARATRREVIRVPLSRRIAKGLLERVPGVRSLIRIPPQAIDYFTHPTHYTSDHTRRDLEGTGIRVPPFPDYVDALVRFVRENPEIGSEAMA